MNKYSYLQQFNMLLFMSNRLFCTILKNQTALKWGSILIQYITRIIKTKKNMKILLVYLFSCYLHFNIYVCRYNTSLMYTIYIIHNTLFRGISLECLPANNFIAYFQDNINMFNVYIYIHPENTLVRLKFKDKYYV